MAEEKEKEKRKKVSLWKTVLPILVMLLLVGGIVGAYNIVVPAYKFNKEVHGHMENAYYANTPELMKDEILKAIDGMHSLGLTNDTYGAFFPWDKTPDKRMDYQYKHLKSVLERVDAVIEWRDKTYGNTSEPTEQLGDVYEQKMDNIRAFLKEDDWSDWIAEDAFYVNNHLWIYLVGYWYTILMTISLTYMFYFVFRWVGADGKKVWDNDKKKWCWYNYRS